TRRTELPRQALDPGGGLLERRVVEEERGRVRDRVNRTVEVARVSGGIQRIADRNLVADDERAPVRRREQATVHLGIPKRGVDEALAARKAVAAGVVALPGTVLIDSLSLEVANLHIVEERLLHGRDVAALHRDLRGLGGAAEPRVQADVDRQRANLEPE